MVTLRQAQGRPLNCWRQDSAYRTVLHYMFMGSGPVVLPFQEKDETTGPGPALISKRMELISQHQLSRPRDVPVVKTPMRGMPIMCCMLSAQKVS